MQHRHSVRRSPAGKTNESDELSAALEDDGLDFTYESRWKRYRVKLNSFREYKDHKAVIEECVKNAMEYFNTSDF